VSLRKRASGSEGGARRVSADGTAGVRARGNPGGGIAVPSILNDRNNAEPINIGARVNRLSAGGDPGGHAI
jgi:hypothetical protein